MLLILAALWGASYLFFRIAGPVLGPLLLAALRVALAAVTLLIYALAMRQLPEFGKHWKAFLLLGLLNNVIPLNVEVYHE